jgi:class 3 adenylate cyclase
MSVVNGPRSLVAVVWFSDIAGFSRHSSAMSPYQAANFVQQFLTPQVEAIEKRRGYVDKFIGDAVMAYWIVASASAREECEAALDAAQEVVSSIQRISLGAETVKVRIGLHIGRVSVGNFGTAMRSQFTLIGAEVNKASRLESADEVQVVSGGPLPTQVRGLPSDFDGTGGPSDRVRSAAGESGTRSEANARSRWQCERKAPSRGLE